MVAAPQYVTVTDAARNDIGEFSPVSFDHAHGDDENTFALTAYADQFTTAKGGLVYIDGTDLGGIIDDVSVSLDASGARVVTYKGRTWAGILESLIVQPDAGADYFTVDSPSASGALSYIIQHIGAGDLFNSRAGTVEPATIPVFTFPRYCGAYAGLRKFAEAAGAILHHEYDHASGRVFLSLEARPTLPEVSADDATITLASRRPYNHVIVGGIGELKNRVIVHRYADADGNISATPTFTGAEEMAYFYDLNNAEQADAEEAAEEWLANAQGADTTTVEVTANRLEFDVGDHVTISDAETGTTAEAVIGKKIVRIDPLEGYTTRYVTANATGSTRAAGGEGGSWNYRPNAPAVYYDAAAEGLAYGDALQALPLFATDQASITIPSTGAGSNNSATATVPSKTGYTFAGVIGYNINTGTRQNWLNVWRLYKYSDTEVRASVCNVGSSAANGVMTVDLLYIRTGALQ